MKKDNYSTAQNHYDNIMPDEPKVIKSPGDCWTFDCSKQDCPLLHCENEIQIDFAYQECETCGEHFE